MAIPRGMLEMLRVLAVDGFASVPEWDDPRAQLLAKWNVGGFVSADFWNSDELVASGWPSGVTCCIVPESQQVRLMIAALLMEAKL